jgi:hypothetical protein
MNSGYLIYQAERRMSASEQRQADIRYAQLYTSLTGLLRTVTATRRGARGRRASHPAAASVCVGSGS